MKMPKRPSVSHLLATLVLAAASLPSLWSPGVSTAFAANPSAGWGGDGLGKRRRVDV